MVKFTGDGDTGFYEPEPLGELIVDGKAICPDLSEATPVILIVDGKVRLARCLVDEFGKVVKEVESRKERQRLKRQRLEDYLSNSPDWYGGDVAPKDGRPIAAYDGEPDGFCVCKWRKDASSPDGGAFHLCVSGWYAEEDRVDVKWWCGLPGMLEDSE